VNFVNQRFTKPGRSDQEPQTTHYFSTKSCSAKGAALLLLFCFILCCAQPAAGQAHRTVNIGRSEQLFTVLAALHAAGYGTEVSAAGFHPVRLRLAGELARLEGPAVEAVRQFYREHRLIDPGATLSRYVSLALIVGPPPEFEFRLRRADLPPDVQPIEGFRELLPAFYQEAHIGELWKRVAGEYETEIARLRDPVGEVVLVTTTYVREILSPGQPRTFSIYVEPMVGSKTHLRNYGDDYFIVLGARQELPLAEIRHAFLHFLIDPYYLQHQSALEVAEPFLHFAAKVPGFPAEYAQDAGLFVTECLVRAMELRIDRPPAARLAAALDEAERSGYVLVRALHDALVRYEQSEHALSRYFPELLGSIDVAAEARRLPNVQFAAAAGRSLHGDSPGPAVTDVERWLSAGRREIAARNPAGARELFQRVLERHPEHPEALYGIALAATLEGRADEARELFERLVALPAEPGPELPVSPETFSYVRAWAHIYLGRIYDMEGNRERAVSEYRAALAVPGAPLESRNAAERGLQSPFQPARGPEP
jgi:tetratricopeptide (TPR) repeat protein